MRKIMISLLIVSSMTLNVQAYDQVERIQDMQIMEVSMAKIQKGILYNNKKMVLRGVENLKRASNKIEIAQTDMDYSATFAKKQAKNISRYADKLKESIEANQKHAATTNYTKVLRECVSCHNKIRKWNQ